MMKRSKYLHQKIKCPDFYSAWGQLPRCNEKTLFRPSKPCKHPLLSKSRAPNVSQRFLLINCTQMQFPSSDNPDDISRACFLRLSSGGKEDVIQLFSCYSCKELFIYGTVVQMSLICMDDYTAAVKSIVCFCLL